MPVMPWVKSVPAPGSDFRQATDIRTSFDVLAPSSCLLEVANRMGVQSVGSVGSQPKWIHVSSSIPRE